MYLNYLTANPLELHIRTVNRDFQQKNSHTSDDCGFNENTIISCLKIYTYIYDLQNRNKLTFILYMSVGTLSLYSILLYTSDSYIF